METQTAGNKREKDVKGFTKEEKKTSMKRRGRGNEQKNRNVWSYSHFKSRCNYAFYRLSSATERIRV